MRKITFSQATQEAMAETMAKDPTVFAMGEDLARRKHQEDENSPPP